MVTRLNTGVEVHGDVNIVGSGLWRWDTGSWSQLTTIPVRQTVNTYTKSTPGYGTAGLQRGRITQASGADNEHRQVHLFPESRLNSRLVVPWANKSLKSVGDTQIGQVHGVKLGPNGLYYGYVIRHDIFFSQDSLIQVGLWRWNQAGTVLDIIADEAPDAALPGIQRIYAATAVRDAANVVTATIRDGAGAPLAGHGIVAGHTLSADFTGTDFDGLPVVTGTPTATTVTWADVGAEVTVPVAGTVNDLDGVLPITVESVKDGTSVYVRVWRDDQREPSWSDPNSVVVLRAGVVDPYPDQQGRQGFYDGHTSPTGTFCEWGPTSRSYANG